MKRTTRHLLALVLGLAVCATALVGGAGPAAADTPEEFFAMAAKPAKAGQKEFGVPASVAMAQAALESGWGESSLTKEGNAFFGIKCGSDKGPIANRCIEKVTEECDESGCHEEVAKFRGYASYTDSFRDHGSLLRNNSRYAAAFQHSDDPDQFIREVHKAGYATDPNYADKIISLMKKHDLYTYNSGETPPPPKPTLKEGSKGAAVTEAQKLLIKHGASIKADGVFGAKTKTAVIDFQKSKDLEADGVIGAKTWKALQE